MGKNFKKSGVEYFLTTGGEKQDVAQEVLQVSEPIEVDHGKTIETTSTDSVSLPIQVVDAGPRSETPKLRRGRPRVLDRETKTKRFNILMKPTVYQALEQAALAGDTSVNAILNRLAEDYVMSSQIKQM